MAKTKEQKKNTLEEIKKKIDKQKSIIFVDFSGLKVEDMFALRKSLKKIEGELKIAKKTIIKLALEEKGLNIEEEKLKGEIGLVFGYKDEISPSKAVYEVCQRNPNLKILGGFLENDFRGAEDFITLAKLPSRKELLGRLTGSLASPLTGFVRALEYNLKGLIYILSAIKTN